MIGLIPILFLGILILLFAGRLLVQHLKANKEQATTIEDYSTARAALDSVFVETEAIKRILAAEDMEFVSRVGKPVVARFFLKERSDLATQWLRSTRAQVTSLMTLHLKLASYTYQPNPQFEFKLTVSYLWFMFVSYVLQLSFRLSGPFETVKMIRYTLDMTEYFCSAFSLRLERINAAKLGPRKGPRLHLTRQKP